MLNNEQHPMNEDLDKKLNILYSKTPNKSVFVERDIPYESSLILDHNAFLRRMVGTLTIAVVAVVTTLVVLFISLWHVSSRPPVENAYAVDTDNNIVRLRSTDLPTVTNENVLSFAREKVEKFHQVSFTDYMKHLDGLEPYFCNETAYSNFQKTLINSRIHQQVLGESLVSYARPTAAPRIVEASEDYTKWQVVLPFRWLVGGGSTPTSSGYYTATLNIDRISRARNLKGICVSNYFIEGAGESK